VSKKIVIIGGAGFIGSRLCELLENRSDLDFFILDKSISNSYQKKSVVKNILDYGGLPHIMKDTDIIINLAAEHQDNVKPSSLYYEVNVEGARNVCKAAEENNISKIIFTSSVAIYGLNKPNPDENFPPSPFNDYGKSKYEAEQVYIKWQKKNPVERSLVIIRPTVVFGEGNRGNVYNLLKQIASGKFVRIGNGLNKKSMAYVGNVASFIKYSVNQFGPGIHTYNYVDKPDLNMNELIQVCETSLLKKISKIRVPYFLGLLGGYSFDFLAFLRGKPLPISSVRVKKFCATTEYNASKAHSSGFSAPYSLQDGLDRTLKAEF
tara:strand:- start:600 stop:1562 length:963 start_codon:yes stop_codon:yes gene_type:complete